MRVPLYTPYFCEENVWQLLADPRLEGRERYAVFISNAERQVAMWSQRAAVLPGTPVVWDYHVVVIARGAAGFEVWDLDCTDGCPLPFARWREVTFDVAREMPEDLVPLFRVVTGAEYRARLSSDRAHMRLPDGGFLREPPPWDPIVRAEEPPNLQRFVDVESPFVGEVLDLRELTSRFGCEAGEE